MGIEFSQHDAAALRNTRATSSLDRAIYPTQTERDDEFPAECENPALPNHDHSEVTFRVALSQWMFQSGNSLSTGTILNYFILAFLPTTIQLSIVMTIPEICQSFCLAVSRFRSAYLRRKQVWATCLIIGRIFALLIPVPVLIGLEKWTGAELNFGWIIACLVGWYVFQGIAYVHYLSWISEFRTPAGWGSLFSWRQIGGLCAAVLFPLGLFWLRSWLFPGVSGGVTHDWSYAAILIVGNVVVIASIIPLWRLPDQRRKVDSPRELPVTDSTAPRYALQYLLAGRWFGAVFQGLTQAVLFRYATSVLKIPIEKYLLLITVMLIVQIPCCWIAGQLAKRNHDLTGMFLGMVLTSLAMPLWIFSTPDNWHLTLTAAYMLWGFFGLMNVCGITLCLKFSTPGSTIQNLAWYEQIAGLLAGLAGLAGAAMFDRTQLMLQLLDRSSEGAYFPIMWISFAGRLLACLPICLLAAIWANQLRAPQKIA